MHIPKPSPLAKVSDNETATQPMQTGADASKDVMATNTAASERNGKLVEMQTPVPTDPERGLKAPEGMAPSVTQNHEVEKANDGEMAKGLAVDGVDEMKSVEI